ncbi:uncharacterized protein LOC143231848 isoform X2 [Tachypleus tridentatus]
MDATTFKCKKCRRILFCGEIVVNSHCKSERFLENAVNLQSEGFQPMCSNNTVWYLKEDKLQDWIIEQIDQGDWIKGKLTCPKCHCRIGSFDFVCGSKCNCEEFVLPPVHVVKSKVDCCPGKLQVKNVHGTTALSPPVYEIEHQENDPDREVVRVGGEEGTSSSTTLLPFSTVCLHNQRGDTCEKGLDSFSLLGTMGGDFSDTNNQPLLSEERAITNKPIKNRGSNQPEVLPNQKEVTSSTDKSSEKEVSSVDSSITVSLTCPVCLDFFISPFTCQPCGHVFCEVCLRRIAKPNPTKTYCPMCRQQIGYCEVNKECGEKVRSQFPIYYQSCLRSEARISSQVTPLPWTPNYHRRKLPTLKQSFVLFLCGFSLRNLWQSLCLSMPTIVILVFLNIVSIATFILSYFGCSYVSTFISQMSVILWKMLKHREEHVTKYSSLNTSLELSLAGGALFFLLFVMLGVTIYKRFSRLTVHT